MCFSLRSCGWCISWTICGVLSSGAEAGDGLDATIHRYGETAQAQSIGQLCGWFDAHVVVALGRLHAFEENDARNRVVRRQSAAFEFALRRLRGSDEIDGAFSLGEVCHTGGRCARVRDIGHRRREAADSECEFAFHGQLVEKSAVEAERGVNPAVIKVFEIAQSQ